MRALSEFIYRVGIPYNESYLLGGYQKKKKKPPEILANVFAVNGGNNYEKMRPTPGGEFEYRIYLHPSSQGLNLLVGSYLVVQASTIGRPTDWPVRKRAFFFLGVRMTHLWREVGIV